MYNRCLRVCAPMLGPFEVMPSCSAPSAFIHLREEGGYMRCSRRATLHTPFMSEVYLRPLVAMHGSSTTPPPTPPPPIYYG
jgi:hypothetical protein